MPNIPYQNLPDQDTLNQENPDQDNIDSESLDSESLYNEQILKLAAGLADVDRLQNPDATVVADSPLCGSRVKVDLNYSPTQDRITAYGQEVRACALGKTSAALVARHIVGTSAAELHQLSEQVENMLKNEGTPPAGKWAGFEALKPARAHKSRHASILLPFKALEKAIGQIKSKQDDSSQSD